MMRVLHRSFLDSIGPMTPYDERWHAYQFALEPRAKM